MRILTKYLTREVLVATALVFVSLLMLFAFFDVVGELKNIGRGNYRLPTLMQYVLWLLPGHVYDLFPIAVLIGTLFALTQLNSHSELTVMRASGLSLAAISRSLLIMGVVLASMTFLFGEYVSPHSERRAQQLWLQATNSVVAQAFRSGLWVKDDNSFVNVQQINPDTSLSNLKIYEFDSSYKLKSISLAKRGEHVAENKWRITDVEQTVFDEKGASLRKLAEANWNSVLTPSILTVLREQPSQMSASDLSAFVDHLRDNKQDSNRYEIAFWSKIVYPIAVMVMMLLAVPFSSFQKRSGGVGAKIFVGIMLGLVFHFVNRLFAHIGQLNDWPPFLSASLPSWVFLTLALVMLFRVQRV
ncbi:MAG: LPS export ABC transporter permease LptG [Burkholderiales bacterium]